MFSFREQLQKQHYAPIPFLLSQEELSTAAEHFLNFLRLPSEVKRQLHYKAVLERESAGGYTDKLDIENKDPKEFFHWKPDIQDEETYQQISAEYPAVQTFFNDAKKIYALGEKAAYDIFSGHLSEYANSCFENGKLVRGVLRFLSYAPKQGEPLCAKPHFDKSIGAITLAESAPGLRIGCCDKHELHEVAHKNGTAIFMPGILLHEYSKGAVTPAWHDVVHDPKEQYVTDFCARWAIVFFIDGKHGEYPSWDAVHTPLH